MCENMKNNLCDQAASLPDLLRSQYADLEPKARTVLSTPRIFDIQHIILTGCGDSYAACKAMKYIFERFAKIRTDVITALDLARFTEDKFLGGAPHDPLVIAVSNSGKVARVGEALQRVRKHGAFVLGITGHEDSPLGENSDVILKLDIPKFPSAPGTRSYCACVMALYLLAIRIGEVRGRYTMDVASAYRKDVLKLADGLAALLPAMDQGMKDLAVRWKDFTRFDFVGAGFDEAAAFFGAAKVFEAIGETATWINAEEWLHLNFFMKDPAHIATILFATKDSWAFSRVKETATYMVRLGRPLLIVTDGGKEDFDGLDACYVKVPRASHAASIPLAQYAPVCFLMGYLMVLKGEKSGRGCEGPWSFSKDAACVRNSEIIVR